MHLINRGYTDSTSDGPTGQKPAILPQRVGEGLFKAFFARAVACAKNEEKEREGDTMKDLSREVHHAVFLGGDLTLPANSLKRLSALFEGQGIEGRRAESILAGATDQDGAFRLTSLLNGLREATQEKEKAQGGFVAHSSQVPQIATLLLLTGLGVGQVRSLIEKSLCRDGSLDIGRLEKGLSHHFPGASLDGKLLPLLSRWGIRCEPREIALDGKQLEVGRAIDGPVTASSNELPRRMREILAGLLRERGMPPEEVKSFLEGVSLEYARSILKPKIPIKEATAERELADLVSQAKMPKGDRWDVEAPRKRAIELLRESRSEATRSSSGKDLSARMRGQDPSPEARSASQEVTGEKLQPVRPENRAVKEPVLEKRGDLRRPEGGEASVRPSGGLGLEGPPNATQTAELKGPPSAHESGMLGPYRETLLSLSEKMSWMIQASLQKARIRLSPPELGRLDVQLAVERGHLRARIGAESLVAKEMIDANLSHLKQHLAALGFVVEEFEVLVGLADQRTDGRDDLWASWDERKSFPRQRGKVKTSVSVAIEIGQEQQESEYQVNLRV